jgi:hypothetical protein
MSNELEGQFVRITVYADGDAFGKRLGFAWGINDDSQGFHIIYTGSKAVLDEAPSPDKDGSIILGASMEELDTAVDPDTVRTPAKAWAELAKWKLSQ